MTDEQALQDRDTSQQPPTSTTASQAKHGRWHHITCAHYMRASCSGDPEESFLFTLTALPWDCLLACLQSGDVVTHFVDV